MKTTARSPILIAVVALLILQFFIRSHHIDRQEVFVDEGYHITRAAVVWDFDRHPARESHGKLLLYFWLGLFETDDPLDALSIARLAVALFSLINGAALYLIGRLLHKPVTGLLALGIYAVLPLAFFYERMALGDSFAAGFAALAAWRSLHFSRRPTYREGIILGILLALGAMAKLTMAMIPLLPVAASLI